ncbi:MAG: cytochrome c biogenesis protein CcsA [Planctomycetota bacterium]|nr:MAG: cytochrome c biogenesis protein CcsA [Planctomycetota bacterium]
MNELLVSLIGGIGFAIAAIASYMHLRRQLSWAPVILRIAAVIAIGLNCAYFTRTAYTQGTTELFRHNFDSTLLLATLVGLVGIGVHLSSALRGLDGFLFIVATIIGFSLLSVIHQPSNTFMDRPWFVSHTLAFALSATCFISSGAAGIAYLIMHNVLHKKRPTTLVGHVAPLESLERFGRWTLTIGFPLFSYGILTGVCGVAHTENAERAAWLSDPLVIFSLITWLIYTVMVLCVLLRPQFRGRRAAMLAASGMVIIVVGFLVIDFASTLHR